MKEIKLNGVAFNLQAVANYSNAEDFYSSPSHQHYWGNIAEEERHKRLTFVYEQAKNVNIYDYMPVTEVNILGVDKENNTMTIEVVQSTQGGKIISNTNQVDKFNKLLINEPNIQSDDSSATNKKPSKRKRSSGNSKSFD